MFDHNLVVVKGPSLMHRLDFHAAPKVTDPAQVIYEGGLMSLDSNGQFVAGCAPGGATNVQPMPIFAIQGINDFDANSDQGNISGGVMSGIVATGGFEISTTEFASAPSYLPNTLFVEDTATAGYVTEAAGVAYGAETVVGVVSRPPSINADGKNMLSFWTTYLPSAS
jgi:hypothetical protein